MAQYKYIKSDNTEGTVEANTAEEATLKAPGRATNSGVQLSQPIPVNSLTETVTPVNVPPTPPQPDLTEISSFNQSSVPMPTTADTGKADLASTFKDFMADDEAARNAITAEATSPEFLAKEERTRKLSNELSQLDKDYQDQVKAIRETTSGMTRDQMQGALSEAAYNYENRRANKSLAYNVALGDFKAAQDAIDVKTKALDSKWTRNIQAYEIMKDAIFNDLTESEKIQVQANLTEKQNNAELVRTAYSNALSAAVENNAPSYILDAIDAAASNPNATAADVLKAAGKYATKPAEVKTEQIKLDDGTIQLINSQTGEVISTYGKGTNTPASAAQLLLVNDISNILADPNIDSVFGLTNTINRNIPGTPAYTLSSQINNVIQQAALAQRGQLKGQGTVSDFEGKMLKEAVTALKLNQNPEDAKKALIKLRGAVTTSSGGSAQVAITDKDGNSKVGLANQQMIMDAINSGYRVEYQ